MEVGLGLRAITIERLEVRLPRPQNAERRCGFFAAGDCRLDRGAQHDGLTVQGRPAGRQGNRLNYLISARNVKDYSVDAFERSPRLPKTHCLRYE